MNVEKACNNCNSEACIKIKPINEVLCIDIGEIESVTARAYDKEVDKRRPDGAAITLTNGKNFETPKTAKKVTQLWIDKFKSYKNDEPCSDCNKTTCIKINVVYKSLCIDPNDILVITTRPHDKKNHKRRLDGCRIYFKDSSHVNTAMNMKLVKELIVKFKKR